MTLKPALAAPDNRRGPCKIEISDRQERGDLGKPQRCINFVQIMILLLLVCCCCWYVVVVGLLLLMVMIIVMSLLLTSIMSPYFAFLSQIYLKCAALMINLDYLKGIAETLQHIRFDPCILSPDPNPATQRPLTLSLFNYFLMTLILSLYLIRILSTNLHIILSLNLLSSQVA